MDNTQLHYIRNGYNTRWYSEDKHDCACYRVTAEQLRHAFVELDDALHMLHDYNDYDTCADNVRAFIDVLEDLHDRVRRCNKYSESYLWIPRDAMCIWDTLCPGCKVVCYD